MIIHRYGQYEEPEEPPFTLQDVIRSIADLMMRHGVKFDEALRSLLEQGLPLNLFMRDDGLDNILDQFIREVEERKNDLKSKYDYQGYASGLERKFGALAALIEKMAEGDPQFLDKIREASRNRSSSLLSELWWPQKTGDGGELAEALGQARLLAEELDQAESFMAEGGKDFSGGAPLDRRAAHQVEGKYRALDGLEQELREAKEKGNLFGVNEERLKEALGEEAYHRFAQARDALMEKLAQALQATGEVERDEDNGMFKLTPAAARKVGETMLAEIYSRLKNDGAGGHYTKLAGEGSLEKAKTRPYEYGDSITHMDVPASMINALIRGGGPLPIKLTAEDMEIHETMGVAGSSACVLIDMSGSMSRFGRFYNAKKMALALESLIRSRYPEDSVTFIGFATFARRLPPSAIMELTPEPVVFWGSGVNMKVKMGEGGAADRLDHVPRFFTNMQKGLELARATLAAMRGRNKQIIMITDGAPTAWNEEGSLNLCYPPSEQGYAATLREARACAREGISVNVFMLGSDFDTGYFGEGIFLNRFMKTTRGRIFHPNPDSLTEYVLADYMTHRRRIVEF